MEYFATPVLLISLICLFVGINSKSKTRLFWLCSSSILVAALGFTLGGSVWSGGGLLGVYGLIMAGYFFKLKPVLDTEKRARKAEKFIQKNKELFTEEEVAMVSNYKKEYAALNIQQLQLQVEYEKKFKDRLEKAIPLMEKK